MVYSLISLVSSQMRLGGEVSVALLGRLRNANLRVSAKVNHKTEG
jgi:hypothetical protein